MAGRFCKTVDAYRTDYAKILTAKKNDLTDRKKGTEEALKKMSADSQAGLDALEAENDRDMERRQKEIETERRRVKTALDAIGAELAEFSDTERKKTAEWYQKRQDRITDFKNAERSFRKDYESADKILSTTILGKRKINVILEGVRLDAAVSSVFQAERALSEEKQKESRDACSDIRKITERLSRRIFFHFRRNRDVKCIAENFRRAEAAVKLLEENFVAEAGAERKKTEDLIAAKRSDTNKEKEKLILGRDKDIESMQKRIQKAQAEFENRRAVFLNQQKNRYQTAKTGALNGWKAAEAEWNRKLAETSRAFIKSMEEEFPPDRFAEWMRLFWKHPARIEDYGKLKAMQMNILSGIAELDISAWYKGENGSVVKGVLSKYGILFCGGPLEPKKAYEEGVLVFPFLVSMEEGDSLLFSYPDSREDVAKQMVNMQGMRMLRSVAAGTLRFELFDAIGVGGFSELLRLDPSKKNNPNEPAVRSFAIGEKGSVHSTDIGQQISEARIRLDDLSSQLTGYSSLRAFNDKNPLSRQNYCPVLMLNFPAGLDENGLMALNSMAENCKKWGFSMVLAQPDKEYNAVRPERKRFVDEIQKKVLCLRINDADKSLRIQNPTNVIEKAVKIRFYGPSSAEIMEQVAKEIRGEAVSSGSRKILFDQAAGICPQKSELFSGKADRGFSVPIGYVAGGTPLSLQFDDVHVHTLILGNTGSGKTNLLHVLITNTMLRYSPEEVQIYLIDFKHGVDFSVYTKYNLPGFGSINITNEPGFALAMLEHLQELEKRRGQTLSGFYNNIADYNLKNPEKKLPRILLIVDELYELVQRSPDDIQKKIVNLIDSFVHQWRSFGFHVVISGQDLDKIEQFDTINHQCTTKVAMHCNDGQVQLLMAEEGVSRMHMIDATDQGACVVSLSGGNKPMIEHTAMIPLNLVMTYLQHIETYYLDRKQITNVKIFHTNAASDPNGSVQMYVEHGYLPEPDHHKMFIGDTYSFEQKLDMRPQGNVWVVGGACGTDSGKAAQSVMLFLLISVIMEKQKKGQTAIYCTNCVDKQLRSMEEAKDDRFGQLSESIPALCGFSERDEFRNTMNMLLDELERRQSGAAQPGEEIWWFVAEPERIDNGADSAVMVSDLKILLQQGPKYHMHTILRNRDVTGVQKLTLMPALFDDRIYLEMTNTDLAMVNGSAVPVQPSGYGAVYAARTGMTRFRAYDLPDSEWMQRLYDRLQSKA